jgi:hypothetical protein
MTIDNTGRTTTAELRSDDRRDGRGLRPHYPGEQSSRRSEHAVLGGRQCYAYPDVTSIAG